MRIIHINLKEVKGDYVTLRYFDDEPSDYSSSRAFPTGEIAKWNDIVQRDYYNVVEVESKAAHYYKEYSKIGQDLYDWLDGDDRILEKLLPPLEYGEVTVLAIATAENLADLPWELLHNGDEFLVERQVVPVRWVSSEKSKKLTVQHPEKERALQVLFMASSPLNIEPVLDYEAEERGILAATQTAERRRSIELVVEESGSLKGLSELLRNRDFNYFDILHLIGHATIEDGEICFIAENQTGEADYYSAQKIVKQIKYSKPQLIFLSACNTGKAIPSGTIPSISMSETLIRSGAKAVLGWGKSVLDTNAILAAEVLYEQLSLGREVTQAIASTYEKLIEHKARDWHLLRLYTGDTLPGKLVTSLDNPKRQLAPPPSVATEFLDPEGKVKVATRESFVGRRRQLQKCLAAFKNTDYMGVLIHGMGGLGKSSLAARLGDRYLQRKRVVWVGKVEPDNLANVLANKLDDQEQRNQLQNSGEELKFRLKRVFDQSSGGKSFLLVLDDFEHNLQLRNGQYVLRNGKCVLTLEAANVLNAIVSAIQETDSNHRIIITCRYDFDFSKSEYFYKQPLDALRGTDLRKKWKRLSASDKVDKTFRSYVEKLADGNHRLLEKLHEELKELQKQNIDKNFILGSLETKRKELLPQVFEDKLGKQRDSDQPMRDMLQRGLVFELPVPKEALKAVCETVDELDKCINKAIALGLLEASYDRELLRVPRYLGLEKLDEISLIKKAANVLYQLWYETKAETPEERLLEIHRLARLGNEIDIQVTMIEILAISWQYRSPQKVVKLCTETLEDLKNVSSDVPNNQVARIQNFLAQSNLLLGYYNKAKSEYEKALKMGKKLSDKENSLDFAKTLDGLGYLYTLIGRYDEAKPMLDEALKIRNNEHPDRIRSLSHLAYWYRVQRDWKNAESFYLKALEMCQQILQEDNLVLAESYYNLATVYYEQASCERTENNKYKIAESYYLKALELSSALEEQETLSIAIISSSLAKVYFFQELYEKAQQQFIKALNIREQLLEYHLDIVQDLKHLGYCNYELGEYIKSKCWLFKALEMINDLINKEDPSIDNNHDKLVQYLKNMLDRLEDIYNELGDSNKVEAICYQKQQLGDGEKQTICLFKIFKTIETLLDYLR
ncbi:MAG: tetratricopeptide repeat protein [Pelatocladus maniniholoensis HA4357-MV3]|jgi:tetratricopeptide (TPR) repeat protein|uniref:Tetratricopeptide repeat protein n=1 Tax=Pelatocladus maniniholoensis HA4357-MV3 TaxID=1117104 RepID=A0A9E3HCU2_9NOST|nr:tetratricopeptide repeat protein [Pelatocladus maniniholoensis HA4357-MV3]